MTEPSSPSNPAIIAVFAFGMLSLLGGWIIVQGGGFFHSPGKYATDAVFYTGAPALVMGGLQFIASALAFTWLLRLRTSQSVAALLSFGLVCVPPLLFLVLA